MGGQFDILSRNSFEKYLTDLGFSVKFGHSALIVGTDFEHFSKAKGIEFVNGLTIYKRDGQNLSNDLFESKANAGLFICIVDQNIGEVNYKDKDGFRYLFKDLTTHVDYNSKLLTIQIMKDDMLKIIGLQKLDDIKRKQYVEILDKKLKLKMCLESLMFTELSTIPDRRK